MTTSSFTHDYYSGLYEYLKSNGCIIYKAETKAYISRTEVYAYHNIDDATDIEALDRYKKQIQADSFHDFHSKKMSTPNMKSHEHLLASYYIDFYKNHPQYQKELLNNYSQLARNTINNSYGEFIDSVCNDKKSIIKVFATIPLKQWDVTSLNMKKFDDFIISKGFTEEENNKFLLSFLKARKSYMKDPKYGPIVRDFLLNKYNRDEILLTPYFEFCDFVKDVFIEKAPEFFDESYELSTIVKVSLRKMVTHFCIKGYDTHNYNNILTCLTYAFSQKFKVGAEYVMHNKGSELSTITITHNNPEINKQFVKSKIMNFCNYLKKDPEFKIDVKTINLWFAEDELRNILPEPIAIKKKINKI